METKNFIFSADNYLLINKKIDELVEEIKEDIEIEYLNISEDGISTILAKMMNMNLFQASLLVIRDAKEIEKISDKYFNDILKYLNGTNLFNYLVLVFPLNYSSNRFEMLKKYSTYIEIKQITDISTFISSYLDDNNFSYTKDFIEELKKYSDDLIMLQNMLDQLMCYKSDNKKLNKDDLLAIFTYPLENNVFELSNAVYEANSKRAYEIYQDLLAQKISTNYLLGMLISRFIELYNVYTLVKNNVGQAEIARIFNISSGRAYYLMNDARRMSISRIKKYLNLLSEIDFKSKRGLVNLDNAFSIFLLNL